ncbi:Juxtaposed with another zinc finger protein 1 [Galemys pyrenaicus]|uniref:Juxtaposed with another zinc finger protein 1 n=1 Tax=Galemys pyrenaicus TaxID=202257 RepID=A0A8J6DMB1_GALPY|nr:Juxtaposed with another zinc finger protein 1 [Galemys pyrenaicus]
MTGIAAASFFSNTCRFGGCGLHFPTLADLIEHIEDNHIDPIPVFANTGETSQRLQAGALDKRDFPTLAAKGLGF